MWIKVLLTAWLTIFCVKAVEFPKVGIFKLLPPTSENNAFDITIDDPSLNASVTGQLGLSFPNAVGSWSFCNQANTCIQWGDYAQLNLKPGSGPNCRRIEWTSKYATVLEDCYSLDSNVHWYGGASTHTQKWNIETLPRKLTAYVNGDFMQSPELYNGGVVERYWLLSNGAALVVDPSVPLFFSLNTTRPGKACFVAYKNKLPYQPRDVLTMSYEWCLASNVKEVHQLAMRTFFEKPVGIPDKAMLVRPLWSTWAEYKENVNQSIVLEYARNVVSQGFENSSHIEIDDNWESCYGQEEFNQVKFPNPKEMVNEIKSMGMRVTAWVHPFINYECPLFNEAMEKGYFVKTSNNRIGITLWWQGQYSGIIDVTNPAARLWWIQRLQKLQQETGLDSFKFDAGEVNWLPSGVQLHNSSNRNLWPQDFTTKYLQTLEAFGGLVETRTAYLNQRQASFVRMWDKDSRWGYDNGLKSMIPSLLHFGILGYPCVLPDMIGGNAYDGEVPTKELYIRWMQANIFMPAVQFSIVPWNYDHETVQICLDVLAQREKYAEFIVDTARQAVIDGSPINRPVWWLDPEDRITFTIDDSYLLGNKILVAPVVEEGARSRDIYLPKGSWSDTSGNTFEGKQWLRNISVPLSVVLFFIRNN